MRVFVTGATGFIGSALVPELVGAGHEVLGLVRSDASAATLRSWGADAHKGDLEDRASLTAGVAACDGVIHLAFDTAKMSDGLDELMRIDRGAIEALTVALAGTGKPLVGTSGIMVLTPDKVGNEADAGDPASAAGFRVASENAVLAAAAKDVRACVVRLAPAVHGQGDTHGFIATFAQAARNAGQAAYVGEGANRWPAVHRLDAAHLFRLALERGATGRRYHGVAEEAVAFHEIASGLGAALDLPTVSISAHQMEAQFGPLGHFAMVDNPASSATTRETLGWSPKGPSLREDIRAGVYSEIGRE